ncbi:hypothetical protein D3C84_995290 [compost metagenome]
MAGAKGRVLVKKIPASEADRYGMTVTEGRWRYSWGPAATRRLPSSVSVKRSKFLMKRSARSTALASHSAWSA